MGAILAPAACFVVTPAEAGASPAGTNANEPSYLLEPSEPARGELLVFFNASQSQPARQIGDPTLNFYNAAASRGLHVLALAYESNQVLGGPPALGGCGGADAGCYAAARESVILGVPQPGAPRSVANIRPDEGAVQRIDAALTWIAARRPGRGWEQFLTSGPSASTRIVWTRVVAAGHSQGGGHAAYVGKLFSIRKVIQLSSTCDSIGSTPAPWTSNGVWATSPATSFIGFGNPQDAICPNQSAIWQAMGMAPARSLLTATTCGAGGGTHGASIACTTHYPTWQSFF